MNRDTSDIVSDLTYAIEDFAEEHELGEGREYLCIVPHGWARSADPVVAFATAMRNGAFFGSEARADFYDCDCRARVNDMGSISFSGGKEGPKKVLSIGVSPDARDAWRHYVDALPRVAYLALHQD